MSAFEKSVEQYWDKIAASCNGEALSYGGLNVRSNELAHALLGKDIGLDAVIAVLGERNLDFLCMILGSFKSGAAYLALDPRYPAQRWAEIISLSGAKVIVSTRTFEAALNAALSKMAQDVRPGVLFIEDLAALALPKHNPQIEVGPGHLAYVIYTSGSTGVPKGVMIEQAGMLNNQLSKIPYLQLTQDDVIAQTASQAFDISVWQFLTAFLCGARVEIVPDDIARDPQALLQHVVSSGITVLESVPSLIQSMLMGATIQLPHLRWLLPTGQAMPPRLAPQWFAP